MTQLETEKTLPELAELLDLPSEERQLMLLFGHLRREHNFKLNSQDGVQKYKPSAVKKVLREHREECEGARVHIGPMDLVPTHIPTHAELTSAAKAEGLIAEKDIDKMVVQRMKRDPKLQTKATRFKALTDLGLEPVRDIEGSRFYRSEDLQLIMDRWIEFNTGRDTTPRKRMKTNPGRQRGGPIGEVKQHHIALGGVLSPDICVRFGIDTSRPSASSNFMTKLKNRGLKIIDRDKSSGIYEPNVVDALSPVPSKGPWPAHVTPVSCATIAGFLTSKQEDIRGSRGSVFASQVKSAGIKLYREDQPLVYRQDDLETLWIEITAN